MFKIPTAKLPMLGKKRWQTLWEFLHRLSLHGLNLCSGADPRTSGELFVLRYIKEKLNYPDSPVLFDAGANVGEYTIFLSNFFGDKARIHSFEPSATAFARLRENVGTRPYLFLNNLGLSDMSGEATLYANSPGSALGSIYARDLAHLATTLDQRETVRLTTVDDYAARNNIGKIDLLKIDTEGNELKVMRGAKQLIDADKIKFIQFEFGGADIDARIFFKDFYYFLQDKYRIYRILRDGLREIDVYSVREESFICANYLAEARYQ